MARVSVSEQIINSMMRVLQGTRLELKSIAQELNITYNQAGQEWNDKKYYQLGDIIEHSNRSILSIGNQLVNTKEKLLKLRCNIESYIGTGRARDSSCCSAYQRIDLHTDQVMTHMAIEGQDVIVYDHPTELAERLHSSQGNNTYNMNGTCSLVATANMLTTSGRATTEQEVVDFARANRLCGRSGGTDAHFNRLQQIWQNFGQSSTVSFDSSPQELAQVVESGHGVVMSVNSEILYGGASQDIDGSVDHAIMITSVAHDPVSNEVIGFFICDSGRCYQPDGGRFVDISTMNDAHFNVAGHGIIYTDQVIW